jgi:3-oxoacyl-(acyl-carrier-protein) synthase/3-hydroxymyristoyl/3-hydroxydecanoyl-(acyl carrier protein) dehydratase
MFEPIAVVGRSCLLPGAHSPAALWEAVAAGRDLIAEAPEGRWGLPRALALTDDPKKSRDRAWSARGGYVAGFDFAAAAAADPFRRPTEDLLALDPLFHWVLWCGRQALREAGHDGRPANASAVFGNLSFPSSAMSRYAEHVWFGREAVDPRNRFMSGLPAHLLAEDQGLRGGAFALDAACASSLYALKLACDQLQERSVDLALAGAVCRSDDLFIHVGFCALDAMSRTGRSRPFHKGADGLVPAEGAAFVALMRLDDAIRSGRTVYGVIRGVGLSNDGRGKGLLAPDSSGQRRALRAAWEGAGVDPARLSLLECHATGTPVGDKTEIETLKGFFGDRVRDVPLGSLKSNLGHLITAAGAAGLLKVLGAMHAGVRPPTLHVDDPVDLSGTPFRLLARAEPWASEGPKVAALSAFGFGGNNAHVVVEEFHGPLAPVPAVSRPAPIAVVAVAARAAEAPHTAAFQALAASDRSVVRAAGAAVDQVVLPLDKLKFPPKDLQQSLAQQTLLLAAAMEAAERAGLGASDRTGVYVGCQSDPEVCRYGARWRLAGWYADRGEAAVQALRDGVVPVLESPGVVGNMPNIPANRISSQLDLGGPGFAIAAEELSGTTALRLAARALHKGEIDAAVVGATDLSAEAVHSAAARALGLRGTPGDAAVALVVMREADARAAGKQILATLSLDGDAPRFASLSPRLGRAHAADGLLTVGAAILTSSSPAAVEVATAFGPAADRVVVTPSGPVPAVEPWMPSRPLSLPGHPPAVAAPGVERVPAAPALPPVPPTGPVPAEDLRPGTLPVAPGAARPPQPEPVPVPLPAPAAAPRPTPAPAPAPIAAAPLAAAPPPAPGAVHPAVLLGMADLHRRLGLAHHQYLTEQHRLHAQFLAMRVATTQLLLDHAGAGAAGAPQPLPLPLPLPAPAPAPLPVAPAPAPRPVAVAPATAPAPAPKPTPPVAPPPAAAEKGTGTGTGTGKGPAEAAGAELEPVGPKWSRQELEILASDKISKVFGPRFALQDAFPRQVRMPEPPLLLADRVIGLDAEPGSMTTGVIWTETDVTWDSWYLHDGVMPAGVMIEAGQADLLLISWLGADFENKGKRVYRLLGCRLVYHGGLARPGDTLRYQIHVDGHANLGATRIFFFHSDCRDQDGTPRLMVREGQAGFFSDAELAESGGILWTPETGEHDPKAPAAPPVVKLENIPRTYTREQVEAFAQGDGYACFGQKPAPNGYERLQTHVRTPRIAPRPMNFWDSVSELDPNGGPWKKGYLRAEQAITLGDWFFQGHFKDDPCMPGTMMFEACLQASAFYLTALGFTIRRDGWTFEPVPDVPYDLKCRGQVTPTSKHVVYEVFVESLEAPTKDSPYVTVWADFLCTVQGADGKWLKAFHARKVGLRLRPDWPRSSRADLQDLKDPVPVAVVDGFPFGYDSLVACAWGRPSEAFGPMYRVFDEGRHCARLPGDPYHFMTRLTSIKGAIGKMEIGTAIELEYEVPPDAWYFDENGARTMPYCVLLEAALQPCGWIACYVGSALTTDKDLYFRNLDGTASWLAEVLPTSGTLTTKAKITNISMSAGMIIQSFDVECFLGDTKIYVMKTVFGFFPAQALANQVGITPTDADRATLLAPSDFFVDLTARPAKYCGGPLRLPNPMLLMLDRVTGFWPTGGKKGLGKLRSEKDVDPAEWFFKAHFYTDPVQPGSLGIEAMIQLLQFFLLETDAGKGMKNPRFEPLMIGRELSWKYRGQVIPENKVIRCEIDITEVGRDDRGVYAICDAYLWVDQLRIYGAVGMGMRVVDDPTVPPNPESGGDDAPEGERVLDPAKEPWLADHPPTFTLPSLPAMSMVDQLAAAARSGRKGVVVEVKDVKVHRWCVLPARARTVVTAERGAEVDVALEAWRDAADPALSRFEAVCTGTVVFADAYPAAVAWPAAIDTAPEPDPYASGALFHGPAFQSLTHLAVGPTGSSATLEPAKCTVPAGVLGQGLLDGLTHAIPHDAMHRWSDRIGADVAAYPYRIPSLRFFGPTPKSTIEVEARFQGLDDTGRHPTTRLVARSAAGVWAELVLTEVLVPKGPIGTADPAVRRAYLRDGVWAPGLALSKTTRGVTRPDPAALKASDWLPGTVAAVYGSNDPAVVAAKDHVAAKAGAHPRAITLHDDHAIAGTLPLTAFPLVRSADAVKDGGAPILDLTPVTTFWDRWFGIGRWPVEDLYYGLIRRFLRRVVVTDPAAFEAVKGRSLLFLGNHQVGVESLLFSIVLSGLTGTSTVTLAKAEHRSTWLGRLIAHAFSYPGVKDPEVITFFDRDDKRSLPGIIQRLGGEMAGTGKNVMVHVEGTRSLECRTPVLKMSGAFLDMALQVNAPVLPVRFVGALPAEPLEERLEFPVGMGTQDIVIGAPILPEVLREMPLKARKDTVLAAMNTIGAPPKAQEVPFDGDPAFAAKVAERVARTGVEEPHAVLAELLHEARDLHPDLRRLLDSEGRKKSPFGDDPQGAWLGELRTRLLG